MDLERRTIAEVARLTSMNEALIAQLVRYGVLPGVVERHSVIGVVDVAETRQLAAQLDAVRAGLEGIGISALEAEAKYGLSNPSIYRWNRDGWIRRVGKQFDESDIAYARALADVVGSAPGRAVFPARPRPGRPQAENPIRLRPYHRKPVA